MVREMLFDTSAAVYRKFVQTTENSIAIHTIRQMSHDINGEFC